MRHLLVLTRFPKTSVLLKVEQFHLLFWNWNWHSSIPMDAPLLITSNSLPWKYIQCFISKDKQKQLSEKLWIFLPIISNICFGCSKNVSLRRFFEYPQHMFWFWTMNKNRITRTTWTNIYELSLNVQFIISMYSGSRLALLRNTSLVIGNIYYIQRLRHYITSKQLQISHGSHSNMYPWSFLELIFKPVLHKFHQDAAFCYLCHFALIAFQR